MNDERPNPDKLLKALQREEKELSGATLKIYFGYAAGVGKSYAMLKGAHELKKAGVDVVVGFVQPHGRPDTEELMEGLEQIPFKQIAQGGAFLPELDLDEVLARKPQVVLVDEMAHTNANGCRHPKRWQDIDELLKAGISVHTTVNVQHIASLNDIVAQITGVLVRETVPDSLFDAAAEIALIDISPDELLKRLKAGKVYRSAQAERAMGNYFKKANLVALREIALRRTAERVHADVAQAQTSANVQNLWPTQEKILALIDTDPTCQHALRAAARLAASLQAPWVALGVEGARQATRMPAAEERRHAHEQLAQELGGKVIQRSGTFRTEEVLRFAREENVTKIILARPPLIKLEYWLERLEIFFRATNAQVIWVGGPALKSNATPATFTPPAFLWRPYIETTGMVGIAFGVSALLAHLQTTEANIALVYLLSVIMAAVRHGQGASAWAAVLSATVLSFGLSDFTWRFGWENTQYFLTFGLNLLIGLLASSMTSRLKRQAQLAQEERAVAEALYQFSAVLSGATGLHQIIATAQQHLENLFKTTVILYMPMGGQGYQPFLKGTTPMHTAPSEWAVADWVARRCEAAGAGTQTLPRSMGLYLPLKTSEGVVGVVGIAVNGVLALKERIAYEKFTTPLAVKLESVQIAENAEKLYWQAERERLRGDLLSSVSQGLKMPLAVLGAASQSLSSSEHNLSASEKNELLSIIHDESTRLSRVVDNLTHLTRFELGKLPLHRQTVEFNEYIQSELYKLGHLTLNHQVVFTPHEHAIEARIDPLLFGQVLFNLIDNAAQYTPTNSAISVKVKHEGSLINLTLSDEGAGLPEEQLEKIFEKYYRLAQQTRGAGLGLTVCRAIIEAHGGRIWAQNNSPKGLKLTIEVPA